MKVKAIKEKINSLKEEQKALVELAVEEVRCQSNEEKEKYDVLENDIKGLEELLAKANEERFNPENKVIKVEEKKVMNNVEVRERLLKGMKDVLTRVESEEANEFRVAAHADTNGVGLPLSAPTGKNIIPTTISDEILTKLAEKSEVFAEVRKYPTTQGNLALPARITDGKCGFVGEDEAVKAIKIKYEVVNLTQKRCGAFMRITRQLMMDSAFDMKSQVIDVLVEELAIAMERAIFQGDKATEFDGLDAHIKSSTGALNDTELLKDRKILRNETASSGAITLDDIMKAYLSLHPNFVGTAKFYMSREVFNQIALLKDGAGNYLVQSGIINGKPGYSIFGSPVVVTNEIGKADDSNLLLYFGDLSQAYAMMIKRGMTIASVNNDTDAILNATELVAIDIFADGTVVNPQAVVALCKAGE